MPRIPRPADHWSLPQRWRWQDDAICRDVPDADLFFPKGSVAVPMTSEAEAAKQICRMCPVRLHCLQHALTQREDWGVWGGLDEGERREMLRKARELAEQAAAEGKEAADASAA
ncbi:WhiB family transcriptional regulator [Streptomyces roseolus]|uniref:WhiB family transcriptional regulator n=1 Tax=Streptomyces roseolus TaxID=67358 RepID=UPI00378C29C2